MHSRATMEGAAGTEAAGMATPERDVASSVAEFMREAAARQRSSSPAATWAFQAHRFRSGDSAGTATPGSIRGASSGAATGYRTALHQRAAHDSAMLAAMKKQCEAVEDRLNAQITRVQTQSDRMREAIVTRFEDKLSSAEAMHPRMDRKLAELSGNYKGLSDEVQAQLRRVEAMDERLWESRHELEEEFRAKLIDLEVQLGKVSSSFRVQSAASEESMRKLSQKLQRLDEERAQDPRGLEQTEQAIIGLHDRFQALEAQVTDIDSWRVDLGVEVRRPVGESGTEVTTAVTLLERRVHDIAQEAIQNRQELLDAQARMEQQEEHMKMLRARLEAREDGQRDLGEKLKAVERSLEQPITRQLEDAQDRLRQKEALEVLVKRVEGLEEELRGHSAGLTSVPSLTTLKKDPLSDLEDASMPAGTEIEAVLVGKPQVTLPSVLEWCAARLQDVDAKYEDIQSEVALLRAGDPQIAQIVEKLRSVSPAVIEMKTEMTRLQALHEQQEDRLKEAELLKDALPQLSTQVAALVSKDASVHEDLSMAVSELRSEVAEIKANSLTHGAVTNGIDVSKVESAPAAAAEVEELARAREEVRQAADSFGAQLAQIASVMTRCDEAHAAASEAQTDVRGLREELQRYCDSHAAELSIAKANLAQSARHDESLTDAFHSMKAELQAVNGAVKADLERLNSMELESRDAVTKASRTQDELQELKQQVTKLVEEQGDAAEALASNPKLVELERIVLEECRRPLETLRDEVAANRAKEDGSEVLERLRRLEAVSMEDMRRDISEVAEDVSQLKKGASRGQGDADLGIAAKDMQDCRTEMATLQETVASLRVDVASVKLMGDKLSRLEGVDGEDMRRKLEALRDEVQSLVADVREAKSSAAVAPPHAALEESVARCSSDLLELKKEVEERLKAQQAKELNGTVPHADVLARVEAFEGVQRQELEDLRALLEKQHHVKGSSLEGNVQVADLINAVKQDDEAEFMAQQRVLMRIDELCDKIATMDQAVKLNSNGRGMDNEDVLQRLHQVRDNHRKEIALESSIQEKMVEMSEAVSALESHP